MVPADTLTAQSPILGVVAEPPGRTAPAPGVFYDFFPLMAWQG